MYENIEKIIALPLKLQFTDIEKNINLYVPFSISNTNINQSIYRYTDIISIDIKSAVLKSIIFMYLYHHKDKIKVEEIENINSLYDKQSKNAVIVEIYKIAKKYQKNILIEKIISYITTFIYREITTLLKKSDVPYKLLRYNKDGFEIQTKKEAIPLINTINNLKTIYTSILAKMNIQLNLDDYYFEYTKFFKIEYYKNVLVLRNNTLIFIYDNFFNNLSKFLSKKGNEVDITNYPTILKNINIFHLNDDDITYIENELFKIKYINIFDFISDTTNYNKEIKNFYLAVFYYLIYINLTNLILSRKNHNTDFKIDEDTETINKNLIKNRITIDNNNHNMIREITNQFYDILSKIKSEIPLCQLLTIWRKRRFKMEVKQKLKNIQKIRNIIKREFETLYNYMKNDKTYTQCDIYEVKNDNIYEKIEKYIDENIDELTKTSIKEIVITNTQTITTAEYEKIRQNFNEVLYVFVSPDLDIYKILDIYRNKIHQKNDKIKITIKKQEVVKWCFPTVYSIL